MTSRKESLVILYFLSVMFIPLIWVSWNSTSKILDVLVFHSTDYVFSRVLLTKNSCKKYNNRATFDINYNGAKEEGRDGCVLWADKGDLIKVYFNKNDLYDNGVVSKLIDLFIGRLVLLLLLTFLFLKRLTIYRQIKTTPAD